ncbi:hypothetical protein [Stenotrophomonas sp.]|uniref:hypothetical protein n=1 Tax=Stenotrophomonas sp. TaxID=69392 RepID=UPI0028ACBF87|nr:hypothetical protein [Stenotrophomonas sp.]
MTYRTLLITALLTLAACTQAPPAVDPATPGDPAAALVQRFNMGQGLRGLALDAARGTNTYASLVQQLGKDAADQQVQTQLDRHLPQFQAAWDQRLGDLYAQHLTAEELLSLTREGTRSPYAAKFSAVQPEVAAQMRSQSSPLLTELVTKALTP